MRKTQSRSSDRTEQGSGKDPHSPLCLRPMETHMMASQGYSVGVWPSGGSRLALPLIWTHLDTQLGRPSQKQALWVTPHSPASCYHPHSPDEETEGQKATLKTPGSADPDAPRAPSPGHQEKEWVSLRGAAPGWTRLPRGHGSLPDGRPCPQDPSGKALYAQDPGSPQAWCPRAELP